MATARMSQFLRRLTRGMVAETLGELTDGQLLERLATAQDQAGFEALVRRHGPMVYRVCWRVLQQAEDAEDAFQATFLVLARKLQTVKKRDSLASWLHGVAHRVALDAKAQAARRRRHEARAVNTSHPSPPDEMTWMELRSVLDAELGRLPEKWRLPLILCYLEGRPQEEAAAHLGWSRSTLLRRLEEARTALGRRLIRRGVVWSAALSAVLLSDCVAPAAVAPRMIASTVEAASSIATGRAALTAAVSTNVVALTEGVLRTMVTFKLKIATAALVLLVVLAASSGGLLYHTRAAEPRQTVTAEAARRGQKPPADKPVEKGPPGPATWQVGPTLQSHGDRLWQVAFSSDGKWLASSGSDKSVMVWDTAQRKTVHTLAHGGFINSVAFTPDNKTLITASGSDAAEDLIQFWDLETGKEKATLKGHAGTVHHLSLAGNGKILVSSINSTNRAAKGGEIVFWDVETRKKIATTKCDNVYSATLSGDGKKIVTAHLRDGTVKLWDIDEKFELTRSEGLVEGVVTNLCVAPDRKTFIIDPIYANSPSIDIRDFATGKIVSSFAHEDAFVRGVAFSPDGKTLATGCCRKIKIGEDVELIGEIRFWDVATGKEKQTLREKLGPVHSVAFSPDGKALAVGLHHKEKIKLKEDGSWEEPTGGYAGTVILCELKEGKP